MSGERRRPKKFSSYVGAASALAALKLFFDKCDVPPLAPVTPGATLIQALEPDVIATPQRIGRAQDHVLVATSAARYYGDAHRQFVARVRVVRFSPRGRGLGRRNQETEMGIENYCHVALNRVTVKRPAAVRDLLEQYETRPLLEVMGGDADTGLLVLAADDDDGNNRWPSAVRVEDLPAEDDDASAGDCDEAVEELHEADGERGLTELLLALAPFLTSPLTLQAADYSADGCFAAAKEWTVRPGATAVECREVVGFENGAGPDQGGKHTRGARSKKLPLAGALHSAA